MAEAGVRVRRTGESLLVTSTAITARSGQRLFASADSIAQKNVQLRTFYRRDFDGSRAMVGMIHRVKILDSGSFDAAFRALQEEGEVLLEPDLIDVAMHMPTAHFVLGGSFCLLKANPGPNLAVIGVKDGKTSIGWSTEQFKNVPADTDFLIFTRPH
ncbi:MAG TPA: hypothetical protein VEA92_03790 [Candidatus Paceibacterota bacterium]|nr:hypothetical protein [Candidatus Paceibacterota bacterium]